MSFRRIKTSPPSTYLRLITGAVSAGLASLSVVEAQTWNQLVLTVGVTEWGHVVAPLGLATLLPGWRRERAGRLGATLGLAAAALSLSSLAQAALLARRVPARLASAFGEAAPREGPGAPARARPLVVADVLRGVRSPKVRKERMTFVTRDNMALALDLYRPAWRTKDEGPKTKRESLVFGPSSLVRGGEAAKPGAPAPCVVVIHGGSWHGGDSGKLAALNRYLAARGYAVAAINYRLAPTHRFPAQRDDVLAAIDFLKARAPELGIDPRNFALLGRSAGGHLALLIAYTAKDPAIRGVAAFYPPTDLLYGYHHPARKRIIDGITIVENFLGGAPTAVPDAYEIASPVRFTGADCPPTLLIHGGRDNLVFPYQSELLAERLAAAGCRHFYLNLPWATHGCDINFSGPSGQISTYTVERFLAAVTSD